MAIEVEKINTVSIIFPDKEVQNTETLCGVADDCNDILRNFFDSMDIGYNNRRIFESQFRAGKDLPADVVLLFTVRPSKRVTDTLAALLSSKRFHLLRLFCIERLEERWLDDVIINPNEILLTQKDRQDIELAHVPTPEESDDVFDEWIQNFVDRIMLKVQHSDPID